MNTKKLKQLVLDLAIHGKLVPQDPNDEPASELLKRIKEEKAKTAKGKKTAISSDNLDEVPFDVPRGWVWCRLGDLCSKFSTGPFGSMVHKSDYVLDKGIPLVNPTNIKDGKIEIDNLMLVSIAKSQELERYKLECGDILLARRGDLTKCAIITDKEKNWLCGSGSFFLHLIVVLPNYFRIVYSTNYLQSLLSSKSVGATMDNLNQGLLGNIYFPLPPLSEQKRIVSAIEKWFAVIDQIESNEADLRKSIEQTKKKVLDLAIHGKLVEQDENDEPASELLKRIKENHYICKKDDELFDIPSSWIWAKISDVGDLSRGKGFLKSDFVEDGYPCIHYGQIHMKFGLSTKKELTYIPESVAMKSGIAHPNDVIIAITSEDELCSCKSTAWLGDYDVAVGSHAAIYHHKINPMYVSFFLASKCFYDQKILYTHGSKVIEIRPADIGNCYIPLPPLSEQKRIVAKVEEVMGELDKTVEMMG